MTKQANPRNKPKAEKVAKKKFTPRPRNRVPEADPVQEYWSRIISPRDGHVEVQFKGGGPGGVTVLRKDVPRLWRNVNNRKGVCCVYFVTGERHLLAMVSEKELNKMKGTIGDLEMTNHAKTLAYGMKAAKKRKGVPNFSVVEACFGFWFDVCKDDGLEYKLSPAPTTSTTVRGEQLVNSQKNRRRVCWPLSVRCLRFPKTARRTASPTAVLSSTSETPAAVLSSISRRRQRVRRSSRSSTRRRRRRIPC